MCLCLLEINIKGASLICSVIRFIGTYYRIKLAFTAYFLGNILFIDILKSIFLVMLYLYHVNIMTVRV